MNDTEKNASSEQPVIKLIQDIKSKKVAPDSLSKEDRRRCVEFLQTEGCKLAEIGQILGRNERTIRRDLEVIRAAHALSPDPHLAERFIGEMVCDAEISIAHFRRIARNKSVSGMERLMAESGAWKTRRECTEKLQSLGFLPRVPTTVRADVYQHADVDPIASYDQLNARLKQIEKCDRKAGENDPRRAQRTQKLFDEVERGRLSVRVGRLEDKPGPDPQKALP